MRSTLFTKSCFISGASGLRSHNRKAIRCRETLSPKSAAAGEREIANSRTPVEEDLIQLIYVSEAAPWLTQQDLGAIATRSEANNQAADLTGFLLYQDPRFYGVLEGTSRRLFARMEVIATDRRHRLLRILREEPIQRRRFQNWTFGTVPNSAKNFGSADVSTDFIRILSRKL